MAGPCDVVTPPAPFRRRWASESEGSDELESRLTPDSDSFSSLYF